MSIVAISGNNIVYADQFEKGSGLYFTPSPESYWLPCGRYFPLSFSGFNLIEHFVLCEQLGSESSYQTHVLGILVTPKKLVYEYINTYEGIRRRVIPMGPGTRYCRSADMQLEEAMTAAMAIKSELVDAMNLVAKSRKLLLNAYKYTTLHKVYDEMAKRNITLQPPSFARE
ncbi:hypothetical protein AH06_61 [Erwinia phage AH06]|nr:hypothetical protein AH06_61 [Erwinia phage AH06]